MRAHMAKTPGRIAPPRGFAHPDGCGSDYTTDWNPVVSGTYPMRLPFGS
jgi:hypothetical protein